MKIVVKQSYDYMRKMTKEMTYQREFDEELACPKCSNPTKLMMLIDDDEGLVTKYRPKNVKIWPHDCLAIALYLCTECGELVAKWNQG